MDKLKLGRVLLLGSKDETTMGRPFIPGASVVAVVEVSIVLEIAETCEIQGYSYLILPVMKIDLPWQR